MTTKKFQFQLITAEWRRFRRRYPIRFLVAMGYRTRKILAMHRHCKGVVAFIAGMEWNHPLFQRPHQLAQSFAREGYLVFYLSPNKHDDKYRSFEEIEPNLYVAPREYCLPYLPAPIIYTCHIAGATKWLKHVKRPFKLIFDLVDDLSIFASDVHSLDTEFTWLLQHATVVCATADRLRDQLNSMRPDTILCPNAVDYGHFHQETVPPPPSDLQPFLNKPIIGYTGALAHWFDYELLLQCARMCPEYNFVLIGKILHDDYYDYPWYEYPNIHYLGVKSYQQLPEYVAHFTVATIPFRVNKITLATSPVKLFEYFAAGKPVVSTALPECKKYRGVCIAEGAENFSTCLGDIIQGDFDSEVVLREARNNDWRSRGQAILAAVERSQ